MTDRKTIKAKDDKFYAGKGRHLIQFSEIVAGIVLGLGIQLFSRLNVFGTGALPSPGRIALLSPLLLLYLWILVLAILFWVSLKRQLELEILFLEKQAGVGDHLTAILIGFFFYQAFDAVTPDATSLTAALVRTSVDKTLLIFGFLIIVEFWVNATVIPYIWWKACRRNEHHPLWQKSVSKFRWFYCFLMPVKSLAQAILYFLFFMPFVPYFGYEYPLFSHWGLQENTLLIVCGFIGMYVLLEIYLACCRKLLKEALDDHLAAQTQHAHA